MHKNLDCDAASDSRTVICTRDSSILAQVISLRILIQSSFEPEKECALFGLIICGGEHGVLVNFAEIIHCRTVVVDQTAFVM